MFDAENIFFYNWMHYISILSFDMHMTGRTLNCQTFQISRWYLYWPKFLQAVFCYSDTWNAQLIRGVYHLDISFICCFRIIRLYFHVFWGLDSFKKLIGLEKEWSGGTTMVDVQTLLMFFLNTFLRSTGFSDETFIW